MKKIETLTYNYNDKDYLVAVVPDIFTYRKGEQLKIGPSSLNSALYDDKLGYDSDRARCIDEQIYAYVDDILFDCDIDLFTAEIKRILD